MTVILGAVVGVLLFLGGWFAGRMMPIKPKEKPHEEEITEEQLEELRKRREQWDALMSYAGRNR